MPNGEAPRIEKKEEERPARSTVESVGLEF